MPPRIQRPVAWTILLVVGLGAALAACSSDDADDVGDADIVWDLREPIDAVELGTISGLEPGTFGPDLATFTAKDAEVLLAILPTGDRIRIDDNADAYRSNIFGGNPAGGPVDQLLYSVVDGGSADDIRRAAAAFTERWGEAVDPIPSGEPTLSAFVATLTDDVEYDTGDPRADRFESNEIDGAAAAFGFSLTRDGTWSAGITISFRPALPADA